MATDNIEKLYQYYGVLADAKEKISEHEQEYKEILAAVKGSDKEKRLASQFIAKFFNSFPNLADQAIEAHFDLCEDDDVAIRKQAIKDLPSLCKDNKEHTQRIADILAQLLQSDDPTELSIVNNSLVQIIKTDPKGALTGIFSQINQGTDNEIVRERCIKFLAAKIKQLGREIINQEAEDLIISECKKVLEDVVAEEFEHIMELLAWSKMGKTPLGRKELISVLAAMALTPEDWQPKDSEHIDRLMLCCNHALPLFSSQIPSTAFVSFFCEHVLPNWDVIAASDGDTDIKLELLKIFAEMTEHCGDLDKSQEKINAVYDLLMKYLPEAPLPSVETPKEGEDKGEEKEQVKAKEKEELPSVQFSHVECALFGLHALCRRAPAALPDGERLRALRLRLQYTARLTQGYIKKLQEVVQLKKDADTEKSRLKAMALRTTSNINAIIRDLFRTPPSFNTRLHLSFLTKKDEKEEKQSTRRSDNKQAVSPGKRHQPITFEGRAEKRTRATDAELQVYTPPSGKYSQRVAGGGRYSDGSYSNGSYGNRGRGRRPSYEIPADGS